MSSTYSTNLALELITAGEQAGNWGSTTNTNLGTLIEQAISGYTTQTCTGGTDTLTMNSGASATARNMSIELTGTGGGTLVVPGTSPNANKKLYIIYNSTALAITVKVSGQTGVSVPAGKKMFLVCNGTDVVAAVDYFASLSAGSLSLTTPLPVASGGTGSSTLASATASIGAVPAADLPTVGDFLVGVNTSLAVTGASGAAGTATITFAAQTYAPFLLGQAITVAGMNPAGYNATANVTAVTTSSVSYENATTAAFVSGGTVSATVGNIPAGASVVANATTSDIWRARYNVLSGGAVTFTDIADAPYVGAVSIVVSNAAHVITNNATLVVQGGANYTCSSGDILIFTATTTSTFRVSITTASGVPVLPAGTAGNILTSNGTTWSSAAPAAGGTVTSVSGTNGLTGTVTTSGSLSVDTTFGNVGTYAGLCNFSRSYVFAGGTASGSNLGYWSSNTAGDQGYALTGSPRRTGDITVPGGGIAGYINTTAVSGTWRCVSGCRTAIFDGTDIETIAFWGMWIRIA